MKYALLLALLACFECAAQTQGEAPVFDASKTSKVTVKSHAGTSCTTNFIGADKPDQDTLEMLRESCDRKDRGNAILAITGPTNRDLSRMTPAQVRSLRCQGVRDKIEMQKDMEAAGSSGYYNMDTLLTIERQQCGANQGP